MVTQSWQRDEADTKPTWASETRQINQWTGLRPQYAIAPVKRPFFGLGSPLGWCAPKKKQPVSGFSPCSHRVWATQVPSPGGEAWLPELRADLGPQVEFSLRHRGACPRNRPLHWAFTTKKRRRRLAGGGERGTERAQRVWLPFLTHPRPPPALRTPNY